MVPAGNALGVLSSPPQADYLAINVYFPPINRPIARSAGVAIMMITLLPIYGISLGISLACSATPFTVGIARIMDKKARNAPTGSVAVIYPKTMVI